MIHWSNLVKEPLTKSESQYAAEHIGLVYKFLHHYQLDENDNYDRVIFHYLRAVRKYLAREDLREKYKFSTVAWRSMNDFFYEPEVKSVYKCIFIDDLHGKLSRNAPNKEHYMDCNNGWDLLLQTYDFYEPNDVIRVIADARKLATARENEVIDGLLQGYSYNQIAHILDISYPITVKAMKSWVKRLQQDKVLWDGIQAVMEDLDMYHIRYKPCSSPIYICEADYGKLSQRKNKISKLVKEHEKEFKEGVKK